MPTNILPLEAASPEELREKITGLLKKGRLPSRLTAVAVNGPQFCVRPDGFSNGVFSQNFA